MRALRHALTGLQIMLALLIVDEEVKFRFEKIGFAIKCTEV